MTDTMWTTVADHKPDPNEPVRFALQGCTVEEISDALRRLGPGHQLELVPAAKNYRWLLTLDHPRYHAPGAKVAQRPVEVTLTCNLSADDGELDVDLVRDNFVLGVNLLKETYGRPDRHLNWRTHFQKFAADTLSGAVSEALVIAVVTDREALAHEIERAKSVQAEDAAYAMRLLL
jgi:hypothetical protein